MGLKHALVAARRRLLPPSLRALQTESNGLKSLLEQQRHLLEEQSRMLASQSEELQRLRDAVAHLEVVEMDTRHDVVTGEQAIDSKADVRFWAAYGHPGESSSEMRRRFFRSFPPAEGDFRTMQHALTKLLSRFDSLCAEHGLRYWMVGGTLLGAVRHGGFIPWDDDIDLGMMRDDIERLRKITRDSTEFEVTVVWDHIVKSRQIRFRTTDQNNPVFLDLFIFDWCNDTSQENFSRSLTLRREMVAELTALDDSNLHEWAECTYIADGTDSSMPIAKIFNKYLERAHTEGIICSRDHATGIIRSYDNLDEPNGFAWICPISAMFADPQPRLTFEDGSYCIPVEYMAILDGSYADIWALPNDIRTHFQHVSKESLRKNPATMQAIKAFLEED